MNHICDNTTLTNSSPMDTDAPNANMMYFSGRWAERAPEPTGANIQDSPRKQSPYKNPQAPYYSSPTATTNLFPQTAQQLPSRHRHSSVNVNPTSVRCSYSHRGTSSHSHTLARDAFSCLCSGSYVGKVLIHFDQSCNTGFRYFFCVYSANMFFPPNITEYNFICK